MKLAKMRVVEMRKELDARGLDSTGTRPTLLKRLREALNREQANPVEHHPDQTESPPISQEEPQVTRERDNQRPADNKFTPADSNLSPNGTPPTNDHSKTVAAGSIDKSNEISVDERMQKRRERFGAANDSPDTTDEAIERRRKRFGIVQKDDEQPLKRRHMSNVVDKQALREHEEAKKRRAIKFGVSLNAGKGLGEGSDITADEMEKRLKRQRRFQQVG